MLGKDIDVTLDVTTVTVQFEGFESADQGIMGYEWAVGTTPGGEELQGYTKQGIVLKEEMSVAGNGNFFLLLKMVISYLDLNLISLTRQL